MISRPMLSIMALSVAMGLCSGCAGGDRAAAITNNLSDAEIRIDRFESAGEFFALKGHVVSATAVGGAAGIAEPGQEISLTPYFPGAGPDPGNPSHSRLLALPGVPPGSTIRCRIALDSAGAWRIVSVE